MRILTIHADFIEFQARKKAFKDAEKDVSKDKHKVEECLVVFTAVEKSDEKDPNLIVEKYLSQIRDIANQVKVKNIVLYPYAHLSPNLSNPKTAENVMKKAEKLLKKEYKVWRAPFGWYKSFNISCKGHPLSELSREFTVDEKQKGMQGGKDEAFEFNDRALNKEQKISISAALVAGKAVKNIYPKAEIGSIGTYHEQAYVDILNVSVSKENLPKIEREMQKIISKREKIEKGSKKNLNFLQKEIIKDLGKNAEIYKIGNVSVVPLNKKPFVNSTKEIGAFKITNTSSAYWKNNAANDQLARIYCVAFSSKKKLSDYEKKQENLELRDHKKIGEQLELFAFHETSPGIPYWLPKGLIIYRELVKFWKEEHDKLDYKEIATPLINKKELWEISGHWEHYRKDMFVAD
ncbi:MAG: threonyl-tRNA synthetase editing domain-containing protein, partial [Candidatus Nanoarchaeia archaeon]